jgi:hypothetical protein
VNLLDIQSDIRLGHTRVGGHAVREAAADNLLISEVWDGVLSSSAQIIEDYPNDPHGPSCLIYCEVNGIPEHVVLAHPSAAAASQMGLPALVFMITCYRPGGPRYAAKWSPDFKRRLP